MEQAWIPVKDGVRLAATLYMPDGAKPSEKFPALLEYLPYRKDDGTAAGDYPKHAYFARRGYVGVQVDILPFDYFYDREVLVEKVSIPPDVKRGERVNIHVVIRASEPTRGTRQIF